MNLFVNMEPYSKLWTIMGFAISIICANAINIEDDDSSFGRCPWIKNQLRNGRVKVRSRGRIAKFICNPGFELAGRRFATCVRGRWNNPIPNCIARGCHKMPDPPNGKIQEQYRGALLKYDCHPGYLLEGSRSIYCDGNQWSDFAPVCVVANTDPKMSCDFEDPDLCGWMHDPTNDFDWKRNQFSTPSGYVGTGPSYDHTFGKGKGGFYIYIEASLPRKLNDTSRLFSPVYPSGFSGGCFVFWYHLYGSSIGGLRIYIKPESHVFVELSPSWVKYGDQGNQWFKGNVSIPEITENFQIIIEGLRGASYMGDAAVDDVSLRTTDCDQVDNITETVEESTSNSCRGRCREDSDSDSCGCTDSCISFDNCCDDFVKICTPGNDTMIEEIPEEKIPEESGSVTQTTDISNYLETTTSLETSPHISSPLATTTDAPLTTIITTLTNDMTSQSTSEAASTLPSTTSPNPSTISSTTLIPVAESTSNLITTPYAVPTTTSPSITTWFTEASKAMSQPAEISSASQTTYSLSSPTSPSPTTSTRKTYNLRPRSSTTPREEVSSTSSQETQKTYNLRPRTSTTTTTISTNLPTSSTFSTTSTTTTTSNSMDTSLQTAPITSTTQAPIFTSPIEFRSTPTTSLTSSTTTPQTSSTSSTTKRTLPTINWIRRTTTPTTASTTPQTTTTNKPTSIHPRIHNTIEYKSTDQKSTTRWTSATYKMTTAFRRTWPTTPFPRLLTAKYGPDFTRLSETSTEHSVTPILDGHSANHHHSPAPSPGENTSKRAGIIVVTILFIVLLSGILYVIKRRRRTPKQSKLADDSEMRFLSDNEIIEYSDPSVLERMPLS